MLLLVHAVTGFLQLLALLGFGFGVYALNQRAPRRMAARVFKLHWLLGTIAAGLLLTLILAKVVNLPARLQTTPAALVAAHDGFRSQCQALLSQQRFDAAYDTISKRTKTAELVGAHAESVKSREHKQSMARLLSPVLNSLLFHTGVAVAFVPALLRLLLLLWQKRAREANGALDAKFAEKERREWGVFLPVMNTVTLLSLCVSPTFYFFIEPARASRCVYTSGHWYTMTCTLLTFAIVITHLYRNREYCKSSYQLMSWYFFWAAAYLAMALMVLKTTQTFYHDAIEAVDGMMQALPAFCVFTLILIAYQFLTASSRDVGAELTRARKGVLESADEGVSSPANSAAARAAKAKAKKVLGLAAKPAQAAKKASKLLGLDAEEEEEGPSEVRETRSSSRKKAAQAQAEPQTTTTTAGGEEEDDAVLVHASEAEPSPASPPTAPSTSASSSVPDAPPVAPPPPPAGAFAAKPAAIKIERKSPAAKQQPERKEEDPTAALLAGIRKGVPLKHVSNEGATSARRSSLPAEGGLMGALAAKLAAARVAIDGEKEEDKDEEWATI